MGDQQSQNGNGKTDVNGQPGVQDSMHGSLRVKLPALVTHSFQRIDRFAALVTAHTAQPIEPKRCPRWRRHGRRGFVTVPQEWFDFCKSGPERIVVSV